MHRGFFARAISDNPRDPLGSPYGSSVIAAYRSAGSLIALVRDLSAQAPAPTRRLWFLWTHLFSCAVVLGSIVTKCPALSLATSSLVQLDSACELFAGVAETFRAGKVLVSLGCLFLSVGEWQNADMNQCFLDDHANPTTKGAYLDCGVQGGS